MNQNDSNQIPKKRLKRSRNGCHNCKRLKIKCDEKKPSCSYCIKSNTFCDYSIKLTWGGRPYKDTNKRQKINSIPNGSQIAFKSENTKIESGNKPKPYNNQIQFVVQDFNIHSPKSPLEVTTPESNSYYISDSPNKKSRERSRAVGSTKFVNSISNTPNQNTFMTPNGTSILLDTFQAQPVSFHGPDNLAVKNKIEILDNGEIESNKGITTGSVTSSESFEYPNNYSNGMNYLNDAFDKITDGEIEFQLQNSSIFKNYFKKSDQCMIEDEKSSYSSNNANDPYLLDYSRDISKIDEYLPRERNNLFKDNSPMRSMASTATNIDDDLSVTSSWDSQSALQEIQKLEMEKLCYSIPPSLTPLPSLLLNVPFYRSLMHFWVQVACHHLVPAPADIYKDNPFKVLLSQMAMEYPAILTTLLAFSAKLRSSLVSSDDTPDVILDQLLSRSCTELLKLLKDKTSATSNEALATALLLSVFEIFDSKDFSKHRAHTLGARQIIKARSNLNLPLKKDIDTGTERNVTFFLLRWFVYIDIIGSLSATKNSNNYLLIKDEEEKYQPVEEVTMLNKTKSTDLELRDGFDPTSPPKAHIDYLMGFDINFLPQFARITILIRKTNFLLQQCGSSEINLPQELICKALEVKETLLSLLNKDEEITKADLSHIVNLITEKKKQSSVDSPEGLKRMIKENEVLRSTNRVFCFAGIIHLYRRVLLIPRESNLVQDLAIQIGQIVHQNIQSQSPADICVIFCLFTAGCEIVNNEEMRLFFENRFMKIAEMGNINARKGLQIMKRCWATGEDWITAATNLNLDFALL
ncbi:unnamed protein product [Candida verbasci]|uniref:Zn(2)-C6 fungal-type domain-containing protein n=1 Tax=Candida verbasci TaxID=1227364 RepID=A0A9W4TXY1_9ASCO|nr:unnamed protein product [Candida verbasci]